jgi:hypothetical protein
MKLVPQTLMRIVQAGGSVEADITNPDRMTEIATAAARHPNKPRVTFRVNDLYNPLVLASVAEAGQGCVTFVSPSGS